MSLSRCAILRRGLGVFLVALLACVGCGAAKGTVTGTVSYQSTKTKNTEPMKGGLISFFDSKNRPVTAEIQPDGTYTVQGVPAGPAKITVDTKHLNPKTKPKMAKYSPPPGMKMPEGNVPQDSEEQAKRYRWIPDTYSDLQKTPLTHTVTAGKQTKDITLEGP